MDAPESLLKILIIEGNSDDEALLLRQLKRAGLSQHIKVLNDGRTALKYLMCQDGTLDKLAAIFLDLKLPRLSGLDLLEVIRSEKRFAGIPVIVMTSSNRCEDLESCRALGVEGFVAKPLTFSSFAKAFADTFHSRRTAATACRVSCGFAE